MQPTSHRGIHQGVSDPVCILSLSGTCGCLREVQAHGSPGCVDKYRDVGSKALWHRLNDSPPGRGGSGLGYPYPSLQLVTNNVSVQPVQPLYRRQVSSLQLHAVSSRWTSGRINGMDAPQLQSGERLRGPMSPCRG